MSRHPECPIEDDSPCPGECPGFGWICDWVKSDDPGKRRHAIYRTTQPCPSVAEPPVVTPRLKPGVELPKSTPALPFALVDNTPAWLRRIELCLYRDCPGGTYRCKAAKCWMKSAQEGHDVTVEWADCNECLSSMDPVDEVTEILETPNSGIEDHD